MNEAQVNTIITRTLNNKYWGYKIPDPQGQFAPMAVKRPFDGFGMFPDSPFYYETKLIKGGYKALSFSRIEEHQIESLLKIRSLKLDANCVVIACVWEPRKIFELYVLDIILMVHLIDSGKKSILKKEFLELKEKGYAIPIKKKEFDIDLLVEKIIYVKNFQS